MDDPIIVAQAGDTVRQWGEFQFPGIERLPDGRLHVTYTPAGYKDSASDYGKPVAHAVSSDAGKTWTGVSQEAATGHKDLSSAGTLLANGDRLTGVRRKTIKVTDNIRRMLPKPLAGHPCMFKAEDFPKKLAGYRAFRLPAGKTHWQEEYADVKISGAVRGIIAADVEINISGEIRSMKNGVLPFPSIGREASTCQSGITLKDGTVLFTTHYVRLVEGKLREDMAIAFLASTDHGHTWRLKSEIPYQPDKQNDPTWKERDELGWHEGFVEPDITLLPDGSVFCLMRTTVGSTVIGPTYWSRSTDGGGTWSRPEIFDDCGVLPRLLTLKNGVTLACYGRPGFYLRATNDPSGTKWGKRVEIIMPSFNRNNCNWHNRDTCAYGGLAALGDGSALVVYSDFEYPRPPHRTACKTILARKITVQ